MILEGFKKAILYNKTNWPFRFPVITHKPLGRPACNWYHVKALLMLCVISHESFWSDPLDRHQGQKGVCHIPPGGRRDHLQGNMGYLQIHWDCQMQNILLVGTWHLHHRHQGPKGVGHVHLGALGSHLQGHKGYQQIRWDSQMQNILSVGTWHPRHRRQGPKRVGHVYNDALGDHLQGNMGYQQIRWDSQMQNFYWLGPGTPVTGTRDQKR